MKIKKIPLLLSMLLLFAMMPIMAYAEDKPSFILTTSINEANVGDEVIFTVEGHSAKNVYGYELRLSYDPKMLEFRKASTAWEGFTVPPIVEDGSIIFAHSKVGNAVGENGDMHLATLRFEAIGKGDASVQLTRVKLVDNDGSSITSEPALISKLSISTTSYIDTAGHWAEESISRATEKGWVKGYPDGRFAPDKEVTRAEFITMLARALALTASSDQDHTFKDDAQIPQFAKAHVSQSVAAGLVKGYGDETFRPSQWITRSEITVMVMRAIGYEDEMEVSPALAYDDADQIPAWAYPAIAAGTEMGIVKGKGQNKFAPSSNSTRAEAVTLLLRIVDHIGTN
ncbi:S-layer homology domain-containing protein [Paenibacillus camelliae]|uniref:S-layer homology domain-containing protein n=1 Tax=Paenibacillus camelliae TaxID=512410 RepID=UPI0020415C64|nr:S-layer homology domain-containing protein [Paenibacillus camelliae]MCM3633856.1 S-layer homology domain-containing protein [Paenibacillus camelliae]